MAVMDEFREEREALKNADIKTKWQYFLDYYKWWVVGIAAALAFVISMIHSALTAKDNALFGYFLNTYANEENTTPFITGFAETAGIDLKEYEIMLDSTLQYNNTGSYDESTYTSSQKIMVTIAAADVDFLAADEEAFEYYGTTDTFHDLRDIYTEEELEKYKDYLYYVDMDVIREKEAVIEAGNFEGYTTPVYDHLAPEDMADPVPIGFCIQDSPKLAETYYFRSGNVPLGIVVNTQRLDAAKQFVEYLFEGMVE